MGCECDKTEENTMGTNDQLTRRQLARVVQNPARMRAGGGMNPDGASYDPHWDLVDDREFVWEPWTTMLGVTTGGEAFPFFAQPEESYLDLDDVKSCEIRADIYGWASISGATLTSATFTLQTASSQEGPWQDVYAITAATITSIVVSSENASQFGTLRYMRYTIASDTVPWKATFRLTATPQGTTTASAGYPTDSADERTGNLQGWMSIYGLYTAALATSVIQDYEHWWKTDGLQYLTFEVEATMLNAATLILECALNRDGPWQTIAAYTQAYTAARVSIAAYPNDSLPAIGRMARWRIDGSSDGSTPWVACFRVSGRGTN